MLPLPELLFCNERIEGCEVNLFSLLTWKTFRTLNNTITRFEVRRYFTTDGQSVSMSLYRVHLWDLRRDITSCWNVTVWNLRSWSWSRNHVTTDGQSVTTSRCRAHSGTCDQILLSVRRWFSESYCLVSVGRPLWREVGSVICPQSVVIYQYLHQSCFCAVCIYIWEREREREGEGGS
jgi:hypothetical protein